ncbi:MAG: hypothetical protein QOF48_3539 [Verrucomicrobiota bacterium]|jgi:hypothetical protein
MKALTFSLTTALALLSNAFLLPSASAYGAKGHETVGAIADELLHGTAAETHVRSLLHNGTLSDAATWADRAKGSNLDQEMRDFVHHNPKHHHYHYTDVPIQELHYTDGTKGTAPDDIVHIMKQCIQVLQGTSTAASNPHGFDDRTALLLLAHLVGDLHQPLHVGAAYVNSANRFTNPNLHPIGAEEDQGGNFLKYKSTQLHSYWDNNAVERAMTKASAHSTHDYAVAILQNNPVVPQTTGPAVDWPQKWAEEILPIAAKAHRGLKLNPPNTVHDHFGTHLQWPITKTPTAYDNKTRDTVDDEITIAGHRLAELLQTVWP